MIEDTMIKSVGDRIVVDPIASQTDINQTLTFISVFKPISDGGYEQRFVRD